MALPDGVALNSLPVFPGPTLGTEEFIVTNILGVTYRTPAKTFFGPAPYAGIQLAADTTLNLTDLVSEVVNNTATNINIALPVGTAELNGTFKIVTASTLVGSITITGGGIGFTNVVLTVTGNSVTFYYLNGWRIISKNIG